MKPADHFVWLAAPALAAASVPAAAHVYLSESQALAAVMGEGVTAQREQKILSDAQRRKLEESSGLHFPESSYTFLVGTRQGKLVGYALVLDEIGKSEPITFMVGMSPEGKVTAVAVMAFRESRGWEVKEKRFLRQFHGKTAGDPIRINQDILNYTGATLSSKGLARGVKRALLLLDVFYPGEVRRGPAPSGRLVLPAPPSAIATVGDVALYRQICYRMGTLCEIRLWACAPEEAARAFASGFTEVARIDRVFSNYRDDSELARVNREAHYAPVKVSPEFWDLARYAVRQWRHSRGSFDITVGPLAKAWGFWHGSPRMPASSELAEAGSRVGSDKLGLDPRASTIRFRQQGMELDFGGLAKGYAARRAARCALKHGAIATLVNLGDSSLYASAALDTGKRSDVQNSLGGGEDPSGHVVVPSEARDPSESFLAALGMTRPLAASLARRGGFGMTNQNTGLRIGEWPVAVADPHDPAMPAFYLLLESGWGVSTSGTYEQLFRADGRTLSHLLDPRSGWPVEGLRSATVVARSGRRAEVLTKRLLLSASGEPRALRKMLNGCDFVVLEGTHDQPLSLRQDFRHATVLIPAPG